MAKRPSPCKVLLVAMPWARLEHPSIQLGLLKAILAARDIDAKQLHLFLDFADHLSRVDSSLVPNDYDDVATKYFIGDWIFSVPPFQSPFEPEDAYLQYLRDEGESESFVAKVGAMRKAVPAFLKDAATLVLSHSPQVVGFTTTFGQSVASLVLAKILKQSRPALNVVFGGANCDGSMGAALHGYFPWVDVVVRGDAEPVFADLVEQLLRGDAIEPQPGLCYRSGDQRIVMPLEQHPPLPGESRRRVDYDDYFERLLRSPLAAELSPSVSIPFESSRGCWWGEKHHCTFCGLNGTSMRFRPMNAKGVMDELLYLAKRYQRLNFNAADNIMDRRLLRTLVPELARSKYDFHIFYEVKANLNKAELASLAAAGITEIQPGIESLHSAVLGRMRKGTTALQNIRLLKWCAALGIEVHWNIIFGMPGDSSDEYDEMARVAENCFHFDAPNLIPLSVERFSPFHEDPAAFGIEVLGPKAHYKYAYPLDASDLNSIAYAFDHRVQNQASIEPGLGALRRAVERWQSAKQAPGTGTLMLYRGPGFALVRERRPQRAHYDYRLGPTEASIYDACDSGVSVSTILEKLAASIAKVPTRSQIEAFLQLLLKAGLLYQEGSRYLSLAVEATPRDVWKWSVIAPLSPPVVVLDDIGGTVEGR